MDKENLAFTHHFDEDLSALSRLFCRSTSLKQPLYTIKESWSDFAHPYTGEEFFRQQQICRPPSFPETAWRPPRQHRTNQTKQVVIVGGSGCGGGATAAKRECPGTGVFLPRRYCNNNPPESRKRQACSPANLPARTIQYSNNTLVRVTGHPQTQARINVGLVPPHYEMLMGRRNAMILAAAQQLRSKSGGGVVESSPVNVNNPEVLLPQEWTY